MKPDVQALLGAIRSSLPTASTLSLRSTTHGDDLYELYLLTQIVQSAAAAGATVSFENVSESPTTQLVFRTSPGRIFTRHQPFTHAVLEFPNSRPLEVHIGVRIKGSSQVLHEADVSVIDRQEAQRCRQDYDDPRSSKLQLAIEAKFYSTNLPLGLAREFLGLGADMSARQLCFVSNSTSVSVARVLTAKKKEWWGEAVPGSAHAPRFQSFIENLFHRYQS